MEHSGQAIEALLDEQRLFDPPAAFHAAARIRDEQIYADADRDPAAWWKARALEELAWMDAPTQGLDDSNPPFYKWFADGMLNVSVNCLDRHVADRRRDKAAYLGRRAAATARAHLRPAAPRGERGSRTR